MRRRLLVTYVAFVHAILLLVVVKPDLVARFENRLGFRSETAQPEITDHFRRMMRYHERIDGSVPDGAVVFIGDSHTQGLCADAVIMPSVNYGIGSDTTVGVLSRLPKYCCLKRASAVVLAIGINDMKWRDNAAILANYKNILQALPSECPIVVSALFPVDATALKDPRFSNTRVREFNQALDGLCGTDWRCVFVDVSSKLADEGGSLSKGLQDGDGVHLNNDGYQLWIEALRDALSQARKKPAK